jgi:hypothetical protein
MIVGASHASTIASPAACARWLEVVDDLVQELELPTRRSEVTTFR